MADSKETAFVSYAQENPTHDRLVRDLADRLRGDGIECELDQYEESPAGGWPTWMETMVSDDDRIVLVIPSPKYLARWRLTEKAGVGLGAKWEAKLLKQNLYEAEGFNTRVIPVVIDQDGAKYIPPALRDVTRYDVSNPVDYDKLLRRLLDARTIRMPAVAVPPRLIPELDSQIASAFLIMQRAEAPLPAEVVATAVSLGESDLRAALGADDVAHSIIWDSRDLVTTTYNRPVFPIPVPAEDVIARALDALLGYLERHSASAATSEQLRNVLAFCKTPGVSGATVAGVFALLQKPLKRLGDKRLVFETASVSLDAARRENRHEQDTREEALILICGTSWVLQRVARLDDADADASRSLELGQTLHWARNTAFCRKCLGRLRRMRAETAIDAGERRQLLADSDEFLRQAIDDFSRLNDKDSREEEGESWSLLGRTLLRAKRLDEAHEAVRRADELLIDDQTKAYLDLLILRGDLNAVAGENRIAEDFYSQAISKGDAGDAQRSEIIARAFLARGKVRVRLNKPGEGRHDFEHAVEIWTRLDDPAVELAEWAIISLDDGAAGLEIKRLEKEPAAVRVRTVRNYRERLGSGSKSLSKRKPAKVEPAFLEQLIGDSKRQLAIENTGWVARIRGEHS